MRSRKTRYLVLTVVGVLLSGLCVVGARHRTIHSTERDPSGKYTAIYTYLTYQSIVPTNAGGSSDKPCFVEIIDSKGNSLGEIPVQMLQIAGVTWLSHGAEDGRRVGLLEKDLLLLGRRRHDENPGSC